MLVLFETPAGFALFKLHDDSKLEKPEKLVDLFTDIEKAKKLVTLAGFHKFNGTTEALSATTALLEGKMDDTLQTFLKTSVVQKRASKPSSQLLTENWVSTLVKFLKELKL